MKKQSLDFTTLLLAIAVMLLMAFVFSSCRSTYSYSSTHGCPSQKGATSRTMGVY